MTTANEALEKLFDMWMAESDPYRKRQLDRQHQRLSAQMTAIWDIDIGEHAAALRSASEKVGKAVDDLEKAIQGNKRVAEAINTVAQVISALVEVVKLIKP